MKRMRMAALAVIVLLGGCDARVLDTAVAVLAEAANEVPTRPAASPEGNASPGPSAGASPSPTAAGTWRWTPGSQLETLPGEPRVEALILAYTNEERQANGAGPVSDDPALRAAARQHSDEMKRLDYFGHSSPVEGFTSPTDRAAWAGYLGGASENLYSYQGKGVTSGPTEAEAERLARLAVDGWMNSDGHRKNLLDPKWRHLGVGIAVRGNKMYGTQNFGAANVTLEEALIREQEDGRQLRVKGSHRVVEGVRHLTATWDGEPLAQSRVDVSAGGLLDVTIDLPAEGTHRFGLSFRNGEGGGYDRRVFTLEAGQPLDRVLTLDRERD